MKKQSLEQKISQALLFHVRIVQVEGYSSPQKTRTAGPIQTSQPCWEGEIAHLSKTQFLQLPGQLRNRNS